MPQRGLAATAPRQHKTVQTFPSLAARHIAASLYSSWTCMSADGSSRLAAAQARSPISCGIICSMTAISPFTLLSQMLQLSFQWHRLLGLQISQINQSCTRRTQPKPSLPKRPPAVQHQPRSRLPQCQSPHPHLWQQTLPPVWYLLPMHALQLAPTHR